MKSTVKELASLTKLYLLQEYTTDAWVAADKDTYHYFKEFAGRNKASATPLPKPLPPVPTPKPFPQTTPRASLPKPSIVQLEKKPLPEPDSIPELQPLTQTSERDLSDWRKIVSNKFPQQKIIDTIPDDAEAKALAFRWQETPAGPQAVLLYSDEPPQQQTFLKSVAQAIESRFCTAQVQSITQFNPSLTYRLVLGQKTVLNTLNLPTSTQTIPLEPIDDYLKQPPLKAALWKQIKDVF